jgi:hypothetical protein
MALSINVHVTPEKSPASIICYRKTIKGTVLKMAKGQTKQILFPCMGDLLEGKDLKEKIVLCHAQVSDACRSMEEIWDMPFPLFFLIINC